MTREAKAQLMALLEKHGTNLGKDSIPGFVWIDSALNQGRIDSRVAVGFYNRSEVEDEILIVDDLEVLLAVVEDDKIRFVGKTIDFKDGRFIFSDKAD